MLKIISFENFSFQNYQKKDSNAAEVRGLIEDSTNAKRRINQPFEKSLTKFHVISNSKAGSILTMQFLRIQKLRGNYSRILIFWTIIKYLDKWYKNSKGTAKHLWLHCGMQLDCLQFLLHTFSVQNAVRYAYLYYFSFFSMLFW